MSKIKISIPLVSEKETGDPVVTEVFGRIAKGAVGIVNLGRHDHLAVSRSCAARERSRFRWTEQHARMLLVTTRIAEYPIDPRFLERWSPRAYDGTPITRDELFTVLEAGRWAPSSFNVQPWRFLYALRDTPSWERFLGLLIPYNQGWAKGAAALVLIVSQKDMPPGRDGTTKPSRSHSFDAGASWALIALQALRLGLYAHGMTGFDADRAASELGVPDSFFVNAIFALGRVGDASLLSPDLAAKEQPNERRPLSETAFEGAFPKP